jgi:hypothetical protein
MLLITACLGGASRGAKGKFKNSSSFGIDLFAGCWCLTLGHQLAGVASDGHRLWERPTCRESGVRPAAQLGGPSTNRYSGSAGLCMRGAGLPCDSCRAECGGGRVENAAVVLAINGRMVLASMECTLPEGRRKRER